MSDVEEVLGGDDVTDLVMERHWRDELTVSDVCRLMKMTEGCRYVHRVAWLGSWLSEDGHHLLCHFRGVDAESMRIASHTSEMPRGMAWTCTVDEPPGLLEEEMDGAYVVVTNHAAEDLTARTRPDMPIQSPLSQDKVRLLRRHRSLDGRRLISVLRAPDEVAAQRAMQVAGLSVERLWRVRRIRPR